MKMILTGVACLFLLTATTAQETQAPAKSTPNAPALEAKVRKVWEDFRNKNEDFRNKNKESLAIALAYDFREVEEGGSGFGDKKAEIAMVDDFEIRAHTLKDFEVKSLGTRAVPSAKYGFMRARNGRRSTFKRLP